MNTSLGDLRVAIRGSLGRRLGRCKTGRDTRRRRELGHRRQLGLAGTGAKGAGGRVASDPHLLELVGPIRKGRGIGQVNASLGFRHELRGAARGKVSARVGAGILRQHLGAGRGRQLRHGRQLRDARRRHARLSHGRSLGRLVDAKAAGDEIKNGSGSGDRSRALASRLDGHAGHGSFGLHGHSTGFSSRPHGALELRSRLKAVISKTTGRLRSLSAGAAEQSGKRRRNTGWDARLLRRDRARQRSLRNTRRTKRGDRELIRGCCASLRCSNDLRESSDPASNRRVARSR